MIIQRTASMSMTASVGTSSAICDATAFLPAAAGPVSTRTGGVVTIDVHRGTLTARQLYRSLLRSFLVMTSRLEGNLRLLGGMWPLVLNPCASNIPTVPVWEVAGTHRTSAHNGPTSWKKTPPTDHARL